MIRTANVRFIPSQLVARFIYSSIAARAIMSSASCSKPSVSLSVANEERRLKHLFDGSDWNVYDSKVLNLGVGAPGTDLLEPCCDIFATATEHRLQFERKENSSLLFQYGPTSGTLEARSSIANYFSQMYGSEVKSEDLIVTSGATQGLQLILATLIDLQGYVFVDEVTYMIALDSIKQFSTLQLVPVRLNSDGVDLVHFEQLLLERRFQSTSKEFWAMYYAIPNNHNPTGLLFTERVCAGLVALARKYDILIACDDVYNILHYAETPVPKRLFAYDARSDVDYRGHVISNGSFAKIIAPGVRLGWLEVPARVKSLLDGCGIMNSGGCLNNYTAGILASLFELGLAQRHIDTMYGAYKERMLATCDVLSRDLPPGCEMSPPHGGYFIWVRLPVTVDAVDFQKFCLREERIYFIAGPRFALQAGTATHCLRISIAFHPTEKLVNGATRLCAALKRYLQLDDRERLSA